MYPGAKKESVFKKFGNFIVKEIKENRTRFFTVIISTLVLIFLGMFVFQRVQTLNVSASERLSYGYYYISVGDTEKAFEYLDEIINNFSNTPAAYQARLAKADIYVEEDKYDEAQAILSEVISKGKPQEMKPLALSRTVSLYDKKGDYQTAVMYANEFIGSYKEHFLIKDIYLNLARYYIALESSEDAKRVLNDILVTFPGSREAAIAEKMIENIQ